VNSEYDVIIIGSGMCGSYFRKKIQKYYSCLTINPIGNQTEYEFFDLSGYFSIEQAQKGNSRNGIGAAAYWGGAITWPTELNYFKDVADKNWSEFHEYILNENLNSKFGLNTGKKSKLTLKSIFPEKSLVYEKQGYFGGARKKVHDATSRVVSDIPHENLTIQSIKRESNYEITLSLNEFGTSQSKVTKSKYLVLAAGPLLNALFYSMLSGQKEFKYGNHLSLTTHTIKFEDIQSIGPWVQTYGHREKAFHTFLPQEMENESNKISGRIRPKEILSKRRTVLQLIRRRDKNYKYKLRNLYRICYSFMCKNEIAVEFDVDLMINQSPTFGSRLLVDSSSSPKKISVDSTVSEECRRLIKRYIYEMDLLIIKTSNLGNEMKSKRKINEEDLNNPSMFRDAAHWYGTLSMETQLGLLDSNFESRQFDNLFALGASGFVEGAVGHPTLLALFSSDRASHVLLGRLPA
jgi:hypothetical protein